MKGNSLARLGGNCSILVGISYLVVGLTYFLVPVEMRGGGFMGADAFQKAMAADSTMIRVEYAAFAIGAILALAAIPAITHVVRSQNEGWAAWGANLGVAGFVVTALQFFRLLMVYPGRAQIYVAGDAVTKQAIISSNPMLNFDPGGFFLYGAIGAWVAIVSLLALRGDFFPRTLSYIGFATGVAYLLVLVGVFFGIEIVIAVGAGLGGAILGPIWYIWTGLRLRQASGEPTPETRSQSPARQMAS